LDAGEGKVTINLHEDKYIYNFFVLLVMLHLFLQRMKKKRMKVVFVLLKPLDTRCKEQWRTNPMIRTTRWKRGGRKT
jgi:hypothetical protein